MNRSDELERARSWASRFYATASKWWDDEARIKREIAAIPYLNGSKKWRKAFSEIYANLHQTPIDKDNK